MRKLRVLVADDSRTVRKRLVEILDADSGIEVIGEAEDGRRAIEICQESRPDLVTMDMMMPVMSGLSATEFIMAHCPTPILVVSASTNRGELFKIYEALAAGAVDVMEKPVRAQPDSAWADRFVAMVKLAARIRVITHLRGRSNPAARLPPAADKIPSSLTHGGRYQLAAIGASTGGPGAIVEILRGLSPDFTLPILLVLHMDVPFGTAFADWLDGQSARRVFLPRDGDRLSDGTGRVAVAPGGEHLLVRDGRIHLTRDKPRHSCRPSVDVLFESVAAAFGPAAIACLLTGMGKDGAQGLLKIREAGGLTIAQDEETSIIYGMPREAINIGAAMHVMRLGEIGPQLSRLQASTLDVPA